MLCLSNYLLPLIRLQNRPSVADFESTFPQGKAWPFPYNRGNTMKFSSSLKLNHIFRRLYSTSGQANSYLVLYARKNRTGTNRVGITVSKKLGHAVVRNRVRRRLREAYRLNESRFQPGWDIVVVARSRCISASFQDIVNAYLTLANKAGILRPDGNQP